MAELEVPATARGSRLDAWLAQALEGGSRTLAERLLEADEVLVDGELRPKAFRLSGGERVSVRRQPRPEQPAKAAPEPRIVWEDEQLVVVDKPAGLVVHPAPGHHSTTLTALLADRAGGGWRPFVVHRLDRDTSGLMLVAKDEAVRRELQARIRRREVEREYLALASGRLGARSGTIEAPIGRDERRRTRMSTRTSKPREARTHFTIERLLDDFTLVRVRLETGRTHQIRAHFAEIGHPLGGDRDYGGAAVPGLERQFLHSARIAFEHPGTGVRLEQRSPLPADLEAALGNV
jgi:23S rRNA pseudouridine1911/1915/1917 synthase